MFNEYFLLQISLIIVVFYFSNVINVLTLWYLAGIYLFLLGFILLLDDGDIFIGFLWVIDLGVGLIFFIFILHFSNFLHQKAQINVYTSQFFHFFILFSFFFIFFYLLSTSINNMYNLYLSQSWTFLISWYDYYDFFFCRTITDLNLMREIYFYNNSFEFFVINFVVLYGIILAILLTFFIKRIFSISSLAQIKNFFLLKKQSPIFFIRNQNFIKQQNTSTGTRVWFKRKKKTKNDL